VQLYLDGSILGRLRVSADSLQDLPRAISKLQDLEKDCAEICTFDFCLSISTNEPRAEPRNSLNNTGSAIVCMFTC
jgi:hypothetical protein